MNLALLDTNVISFLMEDRPLAADYRPLIGGYAPALCFMTVGELYEGAYRDDWGDKKFRKLVRFLDAHPILESSFDVSQRWGEIRHLRRRQPISAEDAWIAATALVYEIPLVTHNPVDFRGIPGLEIITAHD